MHVLGGAENGIYRAGLDTKRTTNAGLFVDHGHQWHIEVFTVLGVKFEHLGIEQVGERDNSGLPTGRALVDRCFTVGNGLGIRPTTRVGALAALSLWQKRVDLIDHGITFHLEADCRITQYQAEQPGHQADGENRE